MILGRLHDIKKYYGIHPNLDKAIRFLEEHDLQEFDAGSYQIDEGNVYMNRFDYETEPESDTFEGHKDFLDIHIVAEGREFLGYADASGLKVVKEYDKDGDFLLYKGRAELRIMLEPGRFAICYPEDAHIPKIRTGISGKVRKAVVKVKL